MTDLYFINQRKNQANNSTIGDIYEKISGVPKWFSYIIEDDSIGVAGDKRVPASLVGKPYKLTIRKENTPLTIAMRKDLPWLEYFIEVNIPGFIGVYFHPLNDQNETLGCQGPNDQMGNNNIMTTKEGGLSRQATQRFYARVYQHLKDGGNAWYEIRDEDKLFLPL